MANIISTIGYLLTSLGIFLIVRYVSDYHLQSSKMDLSGLGFTKSSQNNLSQNSCEGYSTTLEAMSCICEYLKKRCTAQSQRWSWQANKCMLGNSHIQDKELMLIYSNVYQYSFGCDGSELQCSLSKINKCLWSGREKYDSCEWTNGKSKCECRYKNVDHADISLNHKTLARHYQNSYCM